MDAMFTGIIRYVGQVVRATPSPAGKRLRIEIGPLAPGPGTEAPIPIHRDWKPRPSATNRVWGPLSLGASMAVDGACLTVSAISGSEAEFDVVPETLSRSTLAGLTPGDRVNLEPALAAGDAWDGHIVQGHVDGTGELVWCEQLGDQNWWLRLRVPRELDRYLVSKGSIAVDGISLTMAQVQGDEIAVAVIPHTWRSTTLHTRRPGERLNLECDILAKYVAKMLAAMERPAEPPTIEKLRELGY